MKIVVNNSFEVFEIPPSTCIKFLEWGLKMASKKTYEIGVNISVFFAISNNLSK